MASIASLLARAAALRDETALNSISPERAGGIMYDTLLEMNELWLQQGAALVISKIYASVAAMNADNNPVSDLTGQPIRPGMIVVIASSDADNGHVYRYNGTSSPRWSDVGLIGNIDPIDSLNSDSTTIPLAAHQGKVLDGKISQLGQVVRSLVVNITGFGINAAAAGASNLGDIFFHTSQNTLKLVTGENPVTTQSIPTIVGCILIDPTKKLYTWNGTTLKALGTFSVMHIKGVGAGASAAGATEVGDVFFHTTQKILKVVSSNTPSISTDNRAEWTNDDSIYITALNEIYHWDGTNIVKYEDATLKALILEKDTALKSLIAAKGIRLVGISNNGVNAGVTNAGDYFFNTNAKTIKKYLGGDKTQPESYENIPFVDGAIYSCGGSLYIWDGTNLVSATFDDIDRIHYENDELCTIRTFEFDFSHEIIGSTSVVQTMPFNFVNGHTYNIHVIYPANVTDETQFQVRDASQYLMTEIGIGTETRNIQFICSVDGGINLGMKITTLNSAVKYRVMIMDLSDGRLADIDKEIGNLSNTIGVAKDFDFDYSDIILGSNYYRLYLPYNFQNGHTYKIEVTCPEGDTNHSYFQVRDSNNWLQNKILEGEGDRSSNFTCNVDGGILFGMVLQNPTAQAEYDVKLTDLTGSLNIPAVKDIVEYLNYSYQFNELPLYHKTAINSYMNLLGTNIDDKSFVLTFITDLHMRDNYEDKIGGVHGLMCLNEVAKTKLPHVNVLGGDYGDTKTSGEQIPATDFWASMNSCNRLTDGKYDRIALRGNHEVSGLISKDLYFRWASFGSNLVMNPNDDDGSYGYIDFDSIKIRLIAIDTSLINYTGDANDKQLLWLINTAFNLSSKPNYKVVIVSHEALYPFYYAPEQSSYDWGSHPNYRKLVSAFHRGSSVTINGNTVDFTNQGATPLVFIAGHAHQDMSYINSEVDMDFLTILTMDSSTARDDYLRQRIGTYQECAFDTYIIDTVNDTIAVKRYGYGNDRTFSFD